MIDARRGQLALAADQAAEQLDLHRKDCAECSTAKAARQPRLMCVPGWRLYRAKLDALTALDRHADEMRRQVESWPTLFDVPS